MIILDNVTRIFRSGRGVVNALQDLSMKIESGGVTAVVGRSGSGKSTLLNTIGGIEPPDGGKVICGGRSIYDLSPYDLTMFRRRNVGFVFQRSNLLSYLTVAENIAFPLELDSITGKRRDIRVSELLSRIGLSSASKALPHELSGGEAQRVALARAIANFPEILLADEPTASLDTETGNEIFALMQEMGKESGCTVVITTHDGDIAGRSDYVIFLRDGRIFNEENVRDRSNTGK